MINFMAVAYLVSVCVCLCDCSYLCLPKYHDHSRPGLRGSWSVLRIYKMGYVLVTFLQLERLQVLQPYVFRKFMKWNIAFGGTKTLQKTENYIFIKQ